MKDSIMLELAATWELFAESDRSPETAQTRSTLRSCADTLRMLVNLDMQRDTVIKLQEIADVTSRAWAELPAGPTRDAVESLQRRAFDALDDLGRQSPGPLNSPQASIPPRLLPRESISRVLADAMHHYPGDSRMVPGYAVEVAAWLASFPLQPR